MNHIFPALYVSPGYRPIPSEAYVNAFSICRELLRIRGSSGSRTLNGYVRPRIAVSTEESWGLTDFKNRPLCSSHKCLAIAVCRFLVSFDHALDRSSYPSVEAFITLYLISTVSVAFVCE